MPPVPIPAERLEPLLRGSWAGAPRAWEVLHRHREAIRAAVITAWRTLEVRTDEALEDLTSDTVTSIMHRAIKHEGLARPEDWAERTDGFPWLYAVARSHAMDMARRVRKTSRRELPIEPIREGAAPKAQPRAASDPEAELARGRANARLQALLDSSDLKPAHKLVMVLRFFPDHLDTELVEGVAAASDRQQGFGLARPVDETTMLLRLWIDAPPPEEVSANRTLAWILRSTDRAGPDAWRAAYPDDMARALDLVRQWRNRAAKKMGGGE